MEEVDTKTGVSEIKYVEEKPRGLSPEQKVKEQNRIRQLAFKARTKMPKDIKSFLLVTSHLVKNGLPVLGVLIQKKQRKL